MIQTLLRAAKIAIFLRFTALGENEMQISCVPMAYICYVDERRKNKDKRAKTKEQRQKNKD